MSNECKHTWSVNSSYWNDLFWGSTRLVEGRTCQIKLHTSYAAAPPLLSSSLGWKYHLPFCRDLFVVGSVLRFPRVRLYARHHSLNRCLGGLIVADMWRLFLVELCYPAEFTAPADVISSLFNVSLMSPSSMGLHKQPSYMDRNSHPLHSHRLDDSRWFVNLVLFFLRRNMSIWEFEHSQSTKTVKTFGYVHVLPLLRRFVRPQVGFFQISAVCHFSINIECSKLHTKININKNAFLARNVNL